MYLGCWHLVPNPSAPSIYIYIYLYIYVCIYMCLKRVKLSYHKFSADACITKRQGSFGRPVVPLDPLGNASCWAPGPSGSAGLAVGSPLFPSK